MIDFPRDASSNAKVRRRLLLDCSRDCSARRAVFDACASDIVFWVSMFGFTYDPRTRGSTMPFVCYPFQEEALRSLVSAVDDSQSSTVGVDVAIPKSRDMGASWLNVSLGAWFLLFRRGVSAMMVSRNEDLVDARGNPDSLFWKIDFMLRHCPSWMAPRMDRTSMHIANPSNGSVIDGASTTGDVGRGGRRTFILMDEFAAFETRAGYDAASATLSTTRCRIFNSTPKGSANAFHDVCHNPATRVIRLHWSRHPGKNAGLYTSERSAATGRFEVSLLDDWRGMVDVRDGEAEGGVRRVLFPDGYPFVLDGKLRSPWYDAECARCVTKAEIGQELDIDFLGSDYQFFDPAAVDRYKARFCRRPESVGTLVYDADGCVPVNFIDDPKGLMSLWIPLGRDGRPPHGRKYVLGADVSAGTGASNSTMAVYEENTNEKVMEYANPSILPDDFGRLVVAAARFFNEALVVPDRSGPTGEVMVARMRSEGYEGRIYRRKNAKKIGQPVTDEVGVWLNPQARTTVLMQYRSAIADAAVVNRSSRAMDECLAFICRMDGSIEHSASANAKDPGGARSNHGDIVIADALAWTGLREGCELPAASEPETPSGTLKWRMEQAAKSAIPDDDLGERWGE